MAKQVLSKEFKARAGSGRPKLFATGVKPKHHYAALLLALGKSQIETAQAVKMSVEAMKKWYKHQIFQDLIVKYRNQFIEKIKDEGFDDLKFLTNTMVESMKSTAHRSDGLRARELLAKIRGEFSPEEMNVRIQKELEKLSDKDLAKLAKEQVVGKQLGQQVEKQLAEQQDENITQSNTAGNPEKKRARGIL